MSGCQLEEFFELESLASLPKLQSLSLLHNPLTLKPNYRFYVIWKFPNLRLLDFRKIKPSEREQTKSFFSSTEGIDFVKEINRKKLMTN